MIVSLSGSSTFSLFDLSLTVFSSVQLLLLLVVGLPEPLNNLDSTDRFLYFFSFSFSSSNSFD